MASYRSYLEQLAEQIQGYKDFNSRYTPQIDAYYAEQQKGNPYQSKINSYQSQYENFNNTNQNYKTAQALNQRLNNYKYDPNSDNTYQQYMKSYVNNGTRAMEDTLGVAAARTGGLASSYALNAAQQTYNNYMQQLADKIPELAQMERARLSEDYTRNLGLSDKERENLASIRDSYRALGQDRLNELANLINTGRGLRQDEYSQVYQTGYNRLKDAYGSYKSLEDLAMQDEALELQRQQIAAQQALAAAQRAAASQTAVAAKEAPNVDGSQHNLTIGEWQAQQRINNALEAANGWRPASEDDWEYHESNTNWGKKRWKKNKRTGEVVYL